MASSKAVKKTVKKTVKKPTKATANAPRATKPTKPTMPTKPTKSVGPSKTGSARPVPKQLPRIAVKPARPTAPSLPLPPAPPPPAPQRDEMLAPRDIARLLRYGERFGPHKIDIKMLPVQLPSTSSALAICDPAVPKSWRVLDRPVTAGTFRVMLSVARTGDRERLAAVVVHVGRPPIAKWTVAHFKGQKQPRTPDQLPRTSSTSGWLGLVEAGDGSPGPIAVPPDAPPATAIEIALTDGRRALALPCGEGEFAAYWAVDAADKPICLVVDFEVFTQKEWKAKPT